MKERKEQQDGFTFSVRETDITGANGASYCEYELFVHTMVSSPVPMGKWKWDDLPPPVKERKALLDLLGDPAEMFSPLGFVSEKQKDQNFRTYYMFGMDVNELSKYVHGADKLLPYIQHVGG